MYRGVKLDLIFMFGEKEGKSTHWLHKSCLAELVGFEVTDYLLPSGAKRSESLGSKNIARRCCVMQLDSKTASLLEQSVCGEGLGSRWKGGLSWAPERLYMDVTSGVASSAWPSVPWVWGDEKKTTETENKTWITVTSKKAVVIGVSSRHRELPAGKDVLSIPPCYTHCKAQEGLSHTDSSILPVF